MSGKGVVTKDSGTVSNGVVNTSLGRPNPVPTPVDTSSKTVKSKGAIHHPTRYPYNSNKGEIRDHRGL